MAMLETAREVGNYPIQSGGKMGKITDLRSYMSLLEKEGRLAVVDQPVNLVHELADVAATQARMKGKGVIFNPKIAEEVFPGQFLPMQS